MANVDLGTAQGKIVLTADTSGLNEASSALQKLRNEYREYVKSADYVSGSTLKISQEWKDWAKTVDLSSEALRQQAISAAKVNPELAALNERMRELDAAAKPYVKTTREIAAEEKHRIKIQAEAIKQEAAMARNLATIEKAKRQAAGATKELVEETRSEARQFADSIVSIGGSSKATEEYRKISVKYSETAKTVEAFEKALNATRQQTPGNVKAVQRAEELLAQSRKGLVSTGKELESQARKIPEAMAQAASGADQAITKTIGTKTVSRAGGIGQKIVHALTAPLRGIDKILNQIGIGQMFGGVGTKASQALTKTLGKGVDVAGKGMGGKLMAGLGLGMKAVGGVAVAGVGAAVAGIGYALKEGFGRLQQLDEAKAKFKALGYTSAEAATAIENARDAVQDTAFSLPQAVDVATAAMGAGVKAGDDLTKYIGTVADVAAAANIPFESMGDIFNRIQSTGKLTSVELRSLRQTGLPVFKWLQEAAGVSGDQLSEMLRKGQVDSALFRKAMEDNVGGAAKKMGESFKGSMANLRNAIGRLGENILGPLFTGTEESIAPIPKAINKIKDAVDSVGKKVGSWMTENADKIKAGVSLYLGYLQALWTGTVRIIGPILKIFWTIASSIWEAISAVGEALAPLWEEYGPAIKEGFSKAFEVVGNVLESFGNWIANNKEAIIAFFVDLANGVLKFGAVIAKVIGFSIKAIGEFARDLGNLIQETLGFIAKLIRGGAAIVDVWNKITGKGAGFAEDMRKEAEAMEGWQHGWGEGWIKAGDNVLEFGDKLDQAGDKVTEINEKNRAAREETKRAAEEAKAAAEANAELDTRLTELLTTQGDSAEITGHQADAINDMLAEYANVPGVSDAVKTALSNLLTLEGDSATIAQQTRDGIAEVIEMRKQEAEAAKLAAEEEKKRQEEAKNSTKAKQDEAAAAESVTESNRRLDEILGEQSGTTTELTGATEELGTAQEQTREKTEALRAEQEKLPTTLDKSKQSVKSFADDSVRTLGDAADKAKEQGKRFAEGFAEGIQSGSVAVRQAAVDIAQQAAGALPSSPAQWGPLSGSGAPQARGVALGTAFAEGISSTVGAVNKAGVSIAYGAGKPMSDNFDKLIADLLELSGFAKGLVGMFQSVIGIAEQIGGLVKTLAGIGKPAAETVSGIAGAAGQVPEDITVSYVQAGAPGAAELGPAPSTDEVANYIVGEAARRGYTKEQATAIMATAIQESGLSPTAVGGGGAWRGIFQQDISYAATRETPKGQVDAFFDGLDQRMKSAGKGDVWKNIFWLQQAPSSASAEQAYASSRQGYLKEIKGQREAARAYTDQLWGDAKDVAKSNKRLEKSNLDLAQGTSRAMSGMSRGARSIGVDLSRPGLAGEANLQPATRGLNRALSQIFGPQGITQIGGYRAGDPYPYHPSGRALDVMVNNWNESGGKELGDSINRWLIQNAQAIGLEATIWRQTYYGIENGFKGSMMEDRGSATQNHMDHVHLQTKVGAVGLDAASAMSMMGPGSTKNPMMLTEADSGNIAGTRRTLDRGVPEMVEAMRGGDPVLNDSILAVQGQIAMDDMKTNTALSHLDTLITTQTQQDEDANRENASYLSDVRDYLAGGGLTEDVSAITAGGGGGDMLDQIGQIASGAAAIVQDFFDIFELSLKAIQDTKVVTSTLARGIANTEDINRMIDSFQTFLELGAKIAQTVSDVSGFVASLMPSGDPMGGMAAAQSAMQAVSAISGIIAAVIQSINQGIELAQEAYAIGTKYMGRMLQAWFGLPGANDIRYLLDTLTGQLKVYTTENPELKQTFDTLGRTLGLQYGERIGAANQFNIYQGPGQDPRDTMSDAMFAVRSSGVGAFGYAGM